MAADFLKRSQEPAPAEPGASAGARAPGRFERRRRRARLREQLAVREQMLLELGALVFELHRQGQRAPELLQARAADLDAVDAEVRAMQESLDHDDPSAWPTGAAPAWSETGEWDAAAEQTGEWDGAEAEWDQTGEWDATAQTGEWDHAGEPEPAVEGGDRSETAEWAEHADEDLGETQEWSVAEALEAEDVSADPHDPAAEDAVDDPPTEERP